MVKDRIAKGQNNKVSRAKRLKQPKRRHRNVVGQWYLIDATNQRLGRLASQIAFLLMGKHRPDWSPHRSSEDHVVVINADKIMVSGNKIKDKHYRRHSGYPGGLKSRSLEQMLQQHPQFVLEHAVQGMLPKNRLGRELYRHLSVYASAQHPHVGQQPQPLKGMLNSVQDLYQALSHVPPLETTAAAAVSSVAQQTNRTKTSASPKSQGRATTKTAQSNSSTSSIRSKKKVGASTAKRGR